MKVRGLKVRIMDQEVRSKKKEGRSIDEVDEESKRHHEEGQVNRSEHKIDKLKE